MSNSVPISVETNLKLLEGKSFDALVVWLERALRGDEALPSVVAGESPEIPILRRERDLPQITRQDLRTASLTLVRRFVKVPTGNDDLYVAALMRLAIGFDQRELVTDLHLLASDPERLGELPEGQIKSVLFTLLDLKAQLSSEFWKCLVKWLPAGSKVIPITALLRHGPRSAVQVLPALPNDEAVADTLFIIFDQHAGNLNPEEAGKLAMLVREAVPDCPVEIQKALLEWCSDFKEPVVGNSTRAMSGGSALDSALAAYSAGRGETYSPQPLSPRLVRQHVA